MNQAHSTPPRTGFRRFVNSLFAAAEWERVLMAFVAALVVTCAVYRVALAVEIYSHAAQPPSLQPDQVPMWAFLKTLLNDWLVVFGMTLVYLAVKSWLRLRAPRLVATTAASVV